MTNKLAKTGHQSISHAELVSASSTQAVLPWKQQRQALKTLKQVQGDGTLFNNSAFTLIELLVVVLIIGILASVALPQYNKAVRKARLSEVATTFNAISKGIDMYLLENGYPSNGITFSGNGTSDHAKLDIEQTCATEDSTYCYTKVGSWTYSCSPSIGGDRCWITLYTNYHADKTTGNKWLDGHTLDFAKRGDGQWSLDTAYGYVDREICLWWKDMYGNQRVTSGYGASTSTACDAY